MFHLKHTLKPINFLAKHWNITCTAKLVNKKQLAFSVRAQQGPSAPWGTVTQGPWAGRASASPARTQPRKDCATWAGQTHRLAGFNWASRSPVKVTVMRTGQSETRMPALRQGQDEAWWGNPMLGTAPAQPGRAMEVGMGCQPTGQAQLSRAPGQARQDYGIAEAGTEGSELTWFGTPGPMIRGWRRLQVRLVSSSMGYSCPQGPDIKLHSTRSPYPVISSWKWKKTLKARQDFFKI